MRGQVIEDHGHPRPQRRRRWTPEEKVRIAELQRLAGKKTMEAEILREAVSRKTAAALDLTARDYR